MIPDVWLCAVRRRAGIQGKLLDQELDFLIKVAVAPAAVVRVPRTVCCSEITHDPAVPCYSWPRVSSGYSPPRSWLTLWVEGCWRCSGDFSGRPGPPGGCSLEMSLPVCTSWNMWPWCFTGAQWQGTETAIPGRVWHELGGVRWTEGVAQCDGGVWCDAGLAVASLSRWMWFLPVLTLPKPCNKREHAEYREVLPYCFWPMKQYLTLTTCKSKKEGT